jgi:DNA-directed RNA polymerase specialized sigma24 family protein
MGVAKMKPAMSIGDGRYQDRLLAIEAAEGSEEARQRLADRLLDSVRTTMSYITDGADAEDLSRTVLIQILRAADTYRGERSLEAWVDRVAVRCALRHFEKMKRRRALTGAGWVPGHVIDSTADQAAKRRARQELSDPFLRDWMEGRKI